MFETGIAGSLPKPGWLAETRKLWPAWASEGEALALLGKLSAEAPFDFVFIDADKPSYGDYLAWAVDNLRPGGMVSAHNAFRGGKVLAPENDDDRLMDAFNRALAETLRCLR